MSKGLSVLNAPGTIDPDYRGEVKVILVNHSDGDALIDEGERVAQLVICKVPEINLEVVESLSETVRGEGGFGSTGVK